MKNIGREVEVEMVDGERIEGVLEAADEVEMRVRVAGGKKRAERIETLKRGEVKSVRVAIKF